MEIGNWVRRDNPGSRWHLVESIVSDDAVVHCGKRLVPYNTDGPLRVSETKPAEDVCQHCG